MQLMLSDNTLRNWYVRPKAQHGIKKYFRKGKHLGLMKTMTMKKVMIKHKLLKRCWNFSKKTKTKTVAG